MGRLSDCSPRSEGGKVSELELCTAFLVCGVSPILCEVKEIMLNVAKIGMVKQAKYYERSNLVCGIYEDCKA